MYKVFVFNKPVIFAQKDEANLPASFERRKITVDYEIWHYLNAAYLNNGKKGLILTYPKPDVLWGLFEQEHTVIHAGGGAVFNNEGQLLVIYRNGRWDLPKGKLESGEEIEECAVREVEEECGISGVQLKSSLLKTYHTYLVEDKSFLKVSHWYRMTYEGNESLIPQKEEGITKVKWLQKSDAAKIRSNTYGSILDVLDAVAY